MSSTIIENLENSKDIESGLTLNKQTTDISCNVDSSKNCCINYCFKSTIWLLIMIFVCPIPFCDLYYGYTDDTCVSEPAGRLAINLKDYLLIYGWIVMSVIGLLSIGLCFIDVNSFGSETNNDRHFVCGGTFFSIISALVNVFLTIWNIFGAVIFWSLMDISECSNSIYNYVFASLIIKLVFNVIGILQRNNDKDK